MPTMVMNHLHLESIRGVGSKPPNPNLESIGFTWIESAGQFSMEITKIGWRMFSLTLRIDIKDQRRRAR